MTCIYEGPERPGKGELASEGPEHWRGPGGLTLLSWEVDLRAGGAARLRVRSPEGRDHSVEGVRLEIVEPERVVFTGNLGLDGHSEATGTVTFRRTESVV